MHILLNGKITITDCDPKVLKLIKADTTIVNPQRAMAEAMVKNGSSSRSILFAIKPVFKYHKIKNDKVILSRGYQNRLAKILLAVKPEYTFEMKRVSPKMINPLSGNIVFRDYQEGRDDTVLKTKQGILKLSTAWGKTYMAFKLALKTGLRTLIICHKTELTELGKYKKDFKKEFGEDIGVIQGSTFNIKDITVATASTLAGRDIEKIKDEFGLIISDECQSAATDRRMKMLGGFNAEHFYGMSATPTLANGQTKLLNILFGERLIDEELPQASPDVYVYKSNVDVSDIDYARMSKKASENNERNELLARIANNLVIEGRKTLLLVKHIEHGIVLAELLKEKYNIDSYSFSSKDKADKRVDAIQAFREETKDFDVLIGTYGLFAVGVDIPILSAVILAMSVKVDGEHAATLIQAIGRPLRLHPNKLKPVVIDIDDNLNKIMHRHHLGRIAVYKEKDYKIIYKN